MPQQKRFATNANLLPTPPWVRNGLPSATIRAPYALRPCQLSELLVRPTSARKMRGRLRARQAPFAVMRLSAASPSTPGAIRSGCDANWRARLCPRTRRVLRTRGPSRAGACEHHGTACGRRSLRADLGVPWIRSVNMAGRRPRRPPIPSHLLTDYDDPGHRPRFAGRGHGGIVFGAGRSVGEPLERTREVAARVGVAVNQCDGALFRDDGVAVGAERLRRDDQGVQIMAKAD